MKTIRLATRASDLALCQARIVARLIEARLGAATELVPLKTTGDRLQGVSLAKLGGKGLFVKEIEEALLDGRADLAVHSAKDLPASLPAELALVAFPERADPRDALVARERGASLESLPYGARVGTGSVRRSAQLRRLRPDLEIVALRGNVPTRLRKLDEQGLDALVLACAGLERLGLADRIDERIDPERMLPAVAQGALAIEGRRGDAAAEAAAALDHASSAAQVAAERGVLARLEADCNVPLGASARPEGDRLRLRALLTSRDGRRVARAEADAPMTDAASLGTSVAEALLRAGGAEILEELRREAAE